MSEILIFLGCTAMMIASSLLPIDPMFVGLISFWIGVLYADLTRR
jgi:CHASE2 domain-containing sensor protein